MSIPEWAKSEVSIEEAKNYLREGNTVDFFELMSSLILREHPTDIPAFCLEVVQSMADGKETSADGDYHPKSVEDNRYLRERNVCDFLNEWVLALLKERPVTDIDRIEFHKRYLGSMVVGETDRRGDSEGAAAEREKPEDAEDRVTGDT